MCVFVCGHLISNYSTRKQLHYVLDLSNRDGLMSKNTQQGPSGTKVPRVDMCRSIISLSKITYNMWCDHPFSQRNKTTKRAVKVEVGGEGRE